MLDPKSSPLLPFQRPPQELEPRVARLEAQYAHAAQTAEHLRQALLKQRDEQRTDFRLVFSAIAASALGLAALIAKSAGWI